MPLQVSWHPGVPASALYRGNATRFFRFQFRPQRLCLGRLVGIIRPEPCGTVPFFVVGIEIDNMPKR